MRRLTEAAPTAAELRRARDYVIGQIDLSLESTESQMNWLGEQLLGYGSVFCAGAKSNAALRRYSAGQIRAVARDFFRPERLNLALGQSPQGHRASDADAAVAPCTQAAWAP